jgi:hypothetical protein
MVKQWWLRLSILLCALACLGSAQTKTEFKVLLAQPPDSGKVIRPDEVKRVKGVLGGQPLETVGVEAAGGKAASRVVVVLDFGGLYGGVDFCIGAEVLPALDFLRDRPKTTLIATGFSQADVSYVAELGGGKAVATLYGGQATLAHLTGVCGGREQAWNLAFGPYSLQRSARDVLCEAARAYPEEERPVRVFWLTNRFEWFDHRNYWLTEDYRGDPASTTRAVDSCMEDISAAGLTVFPVVFPGFPIQGSQPKYDKSEMASAEALARAMGGFVTKANPLEGPVLRELISATDRGLVLRFRGSPSERTHADGARDLRVTVETGGKLATFQRDFVIPTGRAAAPETAKEILEGIQVVSPSTQVGLQPCMSESTDGSMRRGMRVLLPPEVRAGPPGLLRVYIEYTNTSSGLTKQRAVLHRPQLNECIPMAEQVTLPRFRMVLYDEATGWSGALSGELVEKSAK